MPRFSLTALIATLLPVAASASSTFFDTPSAQQDYLNLSGGIFNVLESNSDTTAQFGAEYRIHEWDFGIRPVIGALANTQGGYYGYGGFAWEVPLIKERLLLVPNVMVGYYHHGDSKDLGGPIEFRDSIELAYQFDNRQRLGLEFTHMSNASIYNHNPGVEALLVEYQVPLGRFW